MNDRSCHSQTEKGPSNVLEKIADARILPLHGVEWDRLIVHRTLIQSIIGAGESSCQATTVVEIKFDSLKGDSFL